MCNMTYMCDITHWYAWQDSLIRVTRWCAFFWLPVFPCYSRTTYARQDLCTCVTWLTYTCDMTHLHVWHDSFTRVTWLILTRDRTHWYVWHDAFVCVTGPIHMCDTTHVYAWQCSFIYITGWCAFFWLPLFPCCSRTKYAWQDPFMCVTWLIYMCDMFVCVTRVWHDAFVCVTGPIHIFYIMARVHLAACAPLLLSHNVCMTGLIQIANM